MIGVPSRGESSRARVRPQLARACAASHRWRLHIVAGECRKSNLLYTYRRLRECRHLASPLCLVEPSLRSLDTPWLQYCLRLSLVFGVRHTQPLVLGLEQTCTVILKALPEHAAANSNATGDGWQSHIPMCQRASWVEHQSETASPACYQREDRRTQYPRHLTQNRDSELARGRGRDSALCGLTFFGKAEAAA